MAFKKGNTLGNKFSKEVQPIENGRKPGAQNRNTIARRVLGMEIQTPKDLYDHFVILYPNLPKKMTIEEISTLAVIKNAINEGDYLRYKAIMDSAYGAPKQEIDMTSEGERINPTITINNIFGQTLANSEKDIIVE